jgi:predicted enzyme related to lactoylglutathione lyase
MTERKLLPGKFVWFELVTKDSKRAQAFYAELFGWTSRKMPLAGIEYELIYAREDMVGAYQAPRYDASEYWISYVSVADVDATAKAVADNGGKVLTAPYDVPEIGRAARVEDPVGATLHLFRNAGGDTPDRAQTPPGHFLWNELHTRDTKAAVSFYQKVLGYQARPVTGTDGDAYNVLEVDGVGRGGISSHLAPQRPSHWLPYVATDDTDAALKRAKQSGGIVRVEATEIPGYGRFGVVEDPGGAVIAVMKPKPPSG